MDFTAKILWLFFSVTLFSTVLAQKTQNSEFMFRKVRFGMNSAQVKFSEEISPVEEHIFENSDRKVLIYSERIAGIKMFLFYVFNQDQLVYAYYACVNECTEKKYIKLLDSLNEIYGQPRANYDYKGNKRSSWSLVKMKQPYEVVLRHYFDPNTINMTVSHEALELGYFSNGYRFPIPLEEYEDLKEKL